jgi:hypothetical protein
MARMRGKERDVLAENIKRAVDYPVELPLSCSWCTLALAPLFYCMLSLELAAALYHIEVSATGRTSTSYNTKNYSAVKVKLFTASTVPFLCGALTAVARASKATHGVGVCASLKQGATLGFFRDPILPEWEHPGNLRVRSFPLRLLKSELTR